MCTHQEFWNVYDGTTNYKAANIGTKSEDGQHPYVVVVVWRWWCGGGGGGDFRSLARSRGEASVGDYTSIIVADATNGNDFMK